ncbi:hypothetical protein ACTHO0_19090 [Cytobacillus praedii]|uniref:hypothetical protein n=1 Tax=Cytobacillus praedii TaxID=1742358 RepID=UPI003F81C9C1
MDQEAFYKEIKIIIESHNKQSIPDNYGPMDNLIELGIIDSFIVNDIILYLEEWTQEEISIDEIEIEDIKSLNSLYLFYRKRVKHGE